MENIVRIGESQVVIGDYKSYLADLLPQKRVIVVTDGNIDRLYGDLTSKYDKIVIGTGEGIKTLATLDYIYRQLIELSADRETFILGIGGGIVTDITGFAASTFMRGVRFGFIATTLLSQVDASVGGKNGVNFDGYKNMVGVFNQPEFVICDTAFLGTLAPREVLSGMAEIIKCGVIESSELFDIFDGNDYKTIISTPALLERAIYLSIKIKADIVKRDERESGDRRKLNFGHTFAHAIEKSSSNYTHGEAVAIGMVLAAKASTFFGSMAKEDSDRIHRVIEQLGLPVGCDIAIGKLIAALKHDKKRSGSGVNFVFSDKIGSSYIKKLEFTELENNANIF